MPYVNPALAQLPVRVQSAQAATATATATATFGATPRLGSVIVGIVHANVASANLSVTTVGSAGWVANDFSSAPTCGIALVTWVAGASESTSVVMNATGATLCRLHIIEYANVFSLAPFYTTSADTSAGTTNSCLAVAAANPIVIITAVATAGTNGGWVSWSLGATVETNSSMETGEVLNVVGAFGNIVGTWTTTRNAGGVQAIWRGCIRQGVWPMLQAMNRASSR